MSPVKLSLVGPGDDREETIELDDEIAAKLREVVDAHPDLSLEDAVRQGLEHVIKNGPARPSLD